MGACAYVGRVGGLAVALGVGAAVLGGTAVGWADDDAGSGVAGPGAGSTQTHRTARGVATAPAGPSDAPATAGRVRGTVQVAPRPAQRESDSATGSVVLPRPDGVAVDVAPQPSPAAAVTPAAVPAAAVTPEPVLAPESGQPAVANGTAAVAAVAAPAAEIVPAAPTAVPPVAAPVAAVASVATAVGSALGDPFADGSRGIPVDSAIDWTVLAFARRNPLAAATTLSAPQAAATTASTLPIIMGPSGVPVPSETYGNTVMAYYFPDATPGTQQLLFTPEGLYPITGVKSLPLNTSVDQGIQILYRDLDAQPAGSPVSVFGYSQSAIIASLLQAGYTVKVSGQDVTFGVPADLQDSIEFVMVGNEMNPDGGFLSRFSGRDMPMLSLTSLGIDFYGATPGGPVPANGVEYPTTNYAREYDGFADFPRYPINLLSALNAGMGIVYVHTQYAPVIDQAACAEKAFCLTAEQLALKQLLPSSKPETQRYYFIPTENLPLLQPLRDIKFLGLGEALADLIQPSLKALVDFGYADPAHGYSSATQPFANELQPFDFLPPASLYKEAFQRFFDGIGQGIKDFIANFGPNGSVTQAISTFALPNLGAMGMGATGGFISTVQKVINSVTDYISGTVAGIYAALLPTADIINALVTSLPAYATNLFLYGMQEVFSGNVIKGLSDAFGLPIAAAVGLSSTAALVGALVWAQGIIPIFGGTAPGV